MKKEISMEYRPRARDDSFLLIVLPFAVSVILATTVGLLSWVMLLGR